MFTVKGKVHYEPTRNFRDNDKTKWWMTIEIPQFEEIARYYRWFINKEWYGIDRIRTYKIDYHRPPHPFHISIIRGEKPRKNEHEWGSYMNGKTIRVKYGNPYQIINPPNANGYFWAVDAEFDEYNEIREHYGLNTKHGDRKFVGHITIARGYKNP